MQSNELARKCTARISGICSYSNLHIFALRLQICIWLRFVLRSSCGTPPIQTIDFLWMRLNTASSAVAALWTPLKTTTIEDSAVTGDERRRPIDSAGQGWQLYSISWMWMIWGGLTGWTQRLLPTSAPPYISIISESKLPAKMVKI